VQRANWGFGSIGAISLGRLDAGKSDLREPKQ